MKIIHLSDLHIGKIVNGYNMKEDQEYILKKILKIIDDESPDAVIIAGDVYDKSIPSAEAVELFDDFLVRLAKRSLQVFVISGNHDSAERLAFGNRLIDASGIHISPVYDGNVSCHTLMDEYGPVNFYSLPFIKPMHVRRYRPDAEIVNYTDAIREALSDIELDNETRNVLIAHQFVTGAETSDSEEISVGGLDNVDASVFEGFAYVALGHIHRPQNIKSERIRYCGTPIKYSFSEAGHAKSVSVVELGAGDAFALRTIDLVPKHDMVEIKGTFDQIMDKAFYENTSYQEDYMHIILTDEDDVPDALTKLRVVYKNMMKMSYDNTRTRHSQEIYAAENINQKSELDLFRELYEMQNGKEMSDEQNEFMISIIEKLKEGR
ncbi:MAG: exonuclease SbcCD subunit D [Firmicutes bacterium]|nr:exonuclease SbcCD subunit D [Bacillota bacterium]